LKHSLSGKRRLEILYVNFVENFGVGKTVEVNGGVDDLSEIHGSFFEIVELVSHGLAELRRSGFGIDSTVGSGNESTFRRTV